METLGDHYKVAKIITMPTTPNFQQSDFRLSRAIGVTSSPFSGVQKTQEYDSVFWIADVSLPLMRRSTAVNWQSFLLDCKGPTNHFQFADPDALTNTGSYNADDTEANKRINNTSVTLSFSGSTITAGASTFANAVVGDFIHVTGATNEDNNGTHKITTVTSNTVVVTSTTFTSESSTASCKVQQNIKGATGLSLQSSSNSATGTIKKGDYLGVLSGTSTTSTPAQLLLVMEDATVTVGSGKDTIAVRTEPKLRSDLADSNLVKFANPKGLFRLIDVEQGWSAGKNSNYKIAFSVVEVV